MRIDGDVVSCLYEIAFLSLCWILSYDYMCVTDGVRKEKERLTAARFLMLIRVSFFMMRHKIVWNRIGVLIDR